MSIEEQLIHGNITAIMEYVEELKIYIIELRNLIDRWGPEVNKAIREIKDAILELKNNISTLEDMNIRMDEKIDKLTAQSAIWASDILTSINSAQSQEPKVRTELARSNQCTSPSSKSKGKTSISASVYTKEEINADELNKMDNETLKTLRNTISSTKCRYNKKHNKEATDMCERNIEIINMVLSNRTDHRSRGKQKFT